MSSIQTEQVAIDTNEFIFALRQTPSHPFCRQLMFSKLSELNLYMPFQVLAELQRNLTAEEMRGIFFLLRQAKSVQWDYTLPDAKVVAKWKARGAKKGDAVISASLEVAGIRYLISENRHFLSEISDLPFQVLSSEAVIRVLGSISEKDS
ncbi:MAG: type II toxin-antitoxin system VapC family toxin [Leptolyngbyaceae bacterium]|nr:type II toxin-antitoxin system VapC family toxin [Leptolyngbyaceae bacterium]